VTNDEAQALLDDIDTNGTGLTDWEADFVDDMLKKTDDGYGPTNREAEKLCQIHEDRVA
jgi:hypothetical protein